MSHRMAQKELRVYLCQTKSLFIGEISGSVTTSLSTLWQRDNKPALAGTAAAPSIAKNKQNQCVQVQKEATENKPFLVLLLLCFTLP